MTSLRCRDSRGFTLTEILVASAILVIFGAAAISILQGAVSMWRQHEAVSDAYLRALDVVKRIQADFEQRAYPHDDDPRFVFQDELRIIDEKVTREDLRRRDLVLPRSSPAMIMIGEDLDMRGYFAFTRYLPDEMTVVPRFGLGSPDEGGIGRHWKPHDRSHNLRAFENLCEVSYIFSPFPRYRGRMNDGTRFSADFIAPGLAQRLQPEDSEFDFSLGGFIIDRSIVPNAPEFVQQGSLEYAGHALYRGFVAPPPLERVPSEYSPGSLYWLLGIRMQEVHDEAGSGGRDAALELIIDDFYRMHEWIADGILYFGGGGCWHQRDPEGLPPPLGLGFQSTPGRSATITVTAESLGPIRSRARLARDLEPEDTELVLTQTDLLPFPGSAKHPFLLIEDEDGNVREWVGYESIRGNRAIGLTRGVRNTVPTTTTIPRGTPVRWGITLQTRVFMHHPTIPTSPLAGRGVPRITEFTGPPDETEPRPLDLFD